MKIKKTKVSEMFQQARESLKLFEAIEKGTWQKAKSFIKIPISGDPKRLTNDRILASLRKLGVATQSETDILRARIEKLEELIETQAKRKSRAASRMDIEAFPKA